MQFMLNEENEVLDVRFKSHFVKNSIGKDVRMTLCTIAEVDKEKQGKDRFNVVAKGEAVQNSKDIDIRKIGQKKAFAKAVMGFPKEKRNIFWDNFEMLK